MRVVFGNWKYLFKNLWYVLPCGIVPAVFLALCVHYTATAEYVRSFFTGSPRADFVQLFRVWSIVRIDSVLGGIYAVFAFFCVGFFAALLVSLVEKHMRIGKRTLNGAGKPSSASFGRWFSPPLPLRFRRLPPTCSSISSPCRRSR